MTLGISLEVVLVVRRVFLAGSMYGGSNSDLSLVCHTGLS